MTDTDTTLLDVSGLRKVYGGAGNETVAIDNVSLTINRGEFVSIVGASGCGKTTLLKCMSGLLPVSAGSVQLNGKSVNDPPEEMALVFQDYNSSLMAWLRVAGNIQLPLRRLKLSRAEREARVADSAAAVGLSNFLNHYPWQLSGGMQQRVAIARALAYAPEILLMDEPFASVDAQTRSDLEDVVLDIWRTHSMTIAFVTHDIDEAIYLADRVVVLAPHPTSVREILDVPLPRPRNQVSSKELPEFGQMRSYVYKALR